MTRASRLATFTDVLSLLVRQQVPLHDAVMLAGASSGDSSIQRFTGEMATQLQNGERAVGVSLDRPKSFPHVLAWLLQSDVDQPELADTLQNLAETYRQRAIAWSRWFSSYIPVTMGVVLGGGMVLLYAFVVLGPPLDLMYQLSIP